MANKNPIIITGSGRLGTTILHKYLIRNSNLDSKQIKIIEEISSVMIEYLQ
jgi:hypothetical protein